MFRLRENLSKNTDVPKGLDILKMFDSDIVDEQNRNIYTPTQYYFSKIYKIL